MNTQKQANPDYPIHKLLAKRSSPCAFADRPVSTENLRSLFEAARWAASSYNKQPWSYIVAMNDDVDAFQALLTCLVERNQAWAWLRRCWPLAARISSSLAKVSQTPLLSMISVSPVPA